MANIANMIQYVNVAVNGFPHIRTLSELYYKIEEESVHTGFVVTIVKPFEKAIKLFSINFAVLLVPAGWMPSWMALLHVLTQIFSHKQLNISVDSDS